MEDNNTEYPISILKVDFGCSSVCPTHVRNMLQKLKGVKSVSVDPNEGKVKVVGNVNPTTLIKFLEKIGKKAELCSFEKEPKKSHSHSHSKQNHHSHSCCESSNSDDDFETDHSSDHHMHGTRHGQRSNHRYDHNERYGFGTPPPMNRNCYGPSMSGSHYQQPPPPPPGYPYHPHVHAPPMPLSQHAAYTYAGPPPPMYSRPMSMYGGYYGSGHPMRPTYGYYDPRMPRY